MKGNGEITSFRPIRIQSIVCTHNETFFVFRTMQWKSFVLDSFWFEFFSCFRLFVFFFFFFLRVLSNELQPWTL